MSPSAGLLLVNQIMPLIQAAVPRTVRRVDAEDVGELIQDTVAQAAQMLDACEAKGSPIYPGSLAFYAVQHAKTGRRSYKSSRLDALHPGARLDGKISLHSMDEPLTGNTEDALSLHDLLSFPSEDPAQQAGREIDWGSLLEDLSERETAILHNTVSGDSLSSRAKQFNVSSAMISKLKREVGRKVKARWGDDILKEIICQPLWAATTNAHREQAACHHERLTEYAT